jgi:hypothetical protein
MSHQGFLFAYPDSLEWNFMFRTLKFFNFGDEFIQWIKLLYNEPLACIKNNGHISENIQISRGIRQGCPVSGLLFVLAVEMLGIKIRTTPSLTGINIGNNNKHVKLSQYADDGIMYLNNNNELYIALNLLSNFGKVAGPVLNIGKCEAMDLSWPRKYS